MTNQRSHNSILMVSYPRLKLLNKIFVFIPHYTHNNHKYLRLQHFHFQLLQYVHANDPLHIKRLEECDQGRNSLKKKIKCLCFKEQLFRSKSS